VNSAKANPNKGLPCSIRVLAAEIKFNVVRIPAASIVRNGKKFTTTMRINEANENAVTRTNDAGRF